MNTIPEPTTCREAAQRFRFWAAKVYGTTDAKTHNARAEILEAFGDAPLPASLLNEWDFGR